MTRKRRIAVGVEYGGQNYSGWQRQKGQNSVQVELERALSRVADETLSVAAAGRTDTGVHATAQVAHFDCTAERDDYAWLRGVNTHLPRDIALLWTREVGDDFHARYSALERAYRYIILNRRVAPAYLHGLVAWHPLELCADKMQRAANSLRGRHDFSAFRAAGCQAKQPDREVRAIEVKRIDQWICIDIRADGFLQHMVRNIVGVLTRIGEGAAPETWAGEVLQSRDRKHAGVTASPAGLYLSEVVYPASYALPPAPAFCKFW